MTHNSGVSCRAVQLRLGFRLRPHRAHPTVSVEWRWCTGRWRGCPLEVWVVWVVVIRCRGCRLARASCLGLRRRPGCLVCRGLAAKPARGWGRSVCVVYTEYGCELRCGRRCSAREPPPALPGTASPVAAGPVAGATSAAPAALPAGLAASGAHTPVPAVGTPGGAAAGAPGAGGMMLPPPGMGGPASPAVAGGAAATVPATASASSGGGGAGAGAAVNPNAGATLVPASVVTPAAGAVGRERPQPSVDVLAATRLAWELARAGDLRNYLLDWAVGKFRSSSGSETVVISNDGSGYVPDGVYLPRDVRLLVADPLVEQEFRDYWFGWQDPARVLVAYAGLRAAERVATGSGGIDGTC